MLSGLYGKLPMKRDFITVSVPDAFLDLWEPWLQGGLTASREELGTRWEEVFLKAPIWRFWLGADLCGLATIGSFMPSVDEVGRFFPLTAFACAGQGASFSPPQTRVQVAGQVLPNGYALEIEDPDYWKSWQTKP